MSRPVASTYAQPAAAAAPPRTARLTSIDTLRGIVMILMALDHVRDYFGVPGQSPTNLAQTTAPLFFTRLMTHLCAPTFFLLTGTGAYLALGRRTIPQLSRFLLTRGLWLVLLEVTVIRCLGFQFNFDYRVTMLVVIWALGWAMIALGVLCRLPLPAILAIGVAMIAGHNLFDGVRSTHPLWVILHTPGILVNRPDFVVFVAYPLIPWIGVTAVGFALGRIYTWDAGRRRAFLLRAGMDRTDCGIPGASRLQPVWRSLAVDSRRVADHDADLVLQRHEVSAVAAVPVDDTRAGAADPARPRWRRAAVPAAGTGLRPGAALLFRAAPAAHPSPHGRPLLCAERRGALDVRIAESRRLPVHAAAGLGAVIAVDLSDLGGSGRDALSRVRVVCRRQAAPGVAVVELFVTHGDRQRIDGMGSQKVPDRARLPP
jgi:uncharacterized membrane protein